MQKYAKYVKIRKNHPRHLYKFLLPWGSLGPFVPDHRGVVEGSITKPRSKSRAYASFLRKTKKPSRNHRNSIGF